MARAKHSSKDKTAAAARREEKLTNLGAAASSTAADMDAADWAEFLAYAARFPRYSLRNRFLMWTQRPDATHVAGYNTWRNNGLQVRKGERGIAILAPNTYRARIDPDTGEVLDDATEGGEPVQKLRSCHIIHVFDISQTEFIPDIITTTQPPPEPQTVDPDDAADLIPQVADELSVPAVLQALADATDKAIQ